MIGDVKWQLIALSVKAGSDTNPMVEQEGIGGYGQSTIHDSMGAGMRAAASTPPGAVDYEQPWYHWGWELAPVVRRRAAWYPIGPEEPLICPAVAGLALGCWTLAPWAQ